MHSLSIKAQSISPSKVICIGRNYVAHIEELGNEVPEDMVVFLKPNSAIGEQLRSQFGAANTTTAEPVHYEGEICFAIEQGQLAAVGFGLDLTLRELQSRLKAKGLPWERAKAFNGAALFSDFVPLPEAGIAALSLELDVNGEPRQRGDCSLMLYPPEVIREQISQFITLEDGDIIMTGTPAGVGPVNSSDTFCGRICCGGKILTEVQWTAR